MRRVPSKSSPFHEKFNAICRSRHLQPASTTSNPTATTTYCRQKNLRIAPAVRNLASYRTAHVWETCMSSASTSRFSGGAAATANAKSDQKNSAHQYAKVSRGANGSRFCIPFASVLLPTFRFHKGEATKKIQKNIKKLMSLDASRSTQGQ